MKKQPVVLTVPFEKLEELFKLPKNTRLVTCQHDLNLNYVRFLVEDPTGVFDEEHTLKNGKWVKVKGQTKCTS